MAQYCPVLRPTFEEFLHFKEYISSIEDIVTQNGICKIIPPPNWNPRHSASCVCGPGNFHKLCNKVKNHTKSDDDRLHTLPSKKGEIKYDTNRFGTHQNADKYMKACRQKTSECLCGFRDTFGDNIRDPVFKLHCNNTPLCAYYVNQYGSNAINTIANKKESTDGYPLSFEDLLSNIDIERDHRHQFGDQLECNSIKCLSMDDIDASVHLFLPFDHLWYEGVITNVNISINACDIKLMDHNTINTSMITVYPMNCIVIKMKTSEESNDNKCECCCKSMMAHELSTRLKEISCIQHPLDMGQIPQNQINAHVSMNTTVFEDDHHMDCGKALSDNSGSADHSASDITLNSKTLEDTNDKVKYLADMIIKAPIRQNLYQSPDAKGGVYHCVNVVEHERMSVRYFYTKTQQELETEIKESKKTKEIMKWIDSDAIEEHIEEIQREWIRNLTYRHPLYGADSIGSLFHPKQLWNFGNLDTILELIATDIEGVTMPYLYFGSWRSMFAWHIEDRALWALNYLHFGKPKIWFAVAPSESYKMEQLMAANFPKDAAYCHVFTRHKNSFVAPKVLTKAGVVWCRAVQRANEIIITAPNAYHSGFNLGFNCAEAVNISTPSWIPIGIQAPHCQCGIMQSSVQFDINALVERMKDLYPRLAAEIPQLPNNYKQILKKQKSPKRQLDCYYVPPSKRLKVCSSSSSRGRNRGGNRRGGKLRKYVATNGVKHHQEIKMTKVTKSIKIKSEYQYTTKKRRGYGRSRASARRRVRQ